MKYRALVSGHEIDCDLEVASSPVVRAVVGDRHLELAVTRLGGGRYWFTFGGRSLEVAVVPSGEGYTVEAGDESFDVVLVDRRRRLDGRTTGRGSRSEFRAPMPGRVVRVLVGDGETVEAGQGLLVLEAMKMQNEIKAPSKGTVRKVEVREDAKVNSGDLLLTFEAE